MVRCTSWPLDVCRLHFPDGLGRALSAYATYVAGFPWPSSAAGCASGSGLNVMRASDRYCQVAALHRDNIDRGFLGTLGLPFLALLYRAIDEADDSVLILEEQDEGVVGFVSGTFGMGPILRRMLRRPIALALAMLPSLVRPARLKRILDIIRYGGGGTLAGLPEAELLSIAVAPAARGTGVSETLYRRLEDHFRCRGTRAFRITVGESLAPAHRFYQRMGARPVNRIDVHEGEPSVVYVQDVAPFKMRE